MKGLRTQEENRDEQILRGRDFEGYIEADSADEAEGNFDESDIEDITILTVYKDEDEDGEQE